MSIKKVKVYIHKKEVLYISNILSISRLVLLPFIIFFLTKDNYTYRVLTIILMSIAVLTDALDGFLARRLKIESALGKMLDPIGDKFSLGAVAIAVTIYRDFPWWAMGFIIFRDMGIIVCGLFMVERWTIITSSNIWGKATSFFQAMAIMAYAFEMPYRSYPLTVALMFTGVSAISYGFEFYNLAKTQIKNDNNK
ncbi:TPA: CDP-alcohol phosphatidyltransferase family protein [bacterium]|nr:CDP-alcohol phosphatidyltransferase family protein [bacterium]